MKKTVKAWVRVNDSGEIQMESAGILRNFKVFHDSDGATLWSQKAKPCTITYDDGKKGKRK